ncbi:hypothetical protein MKW92_037843 [Papaver armeniacum]|nr:hypothetical protein MKW92_037843 [Papaver armeniacum]
MQTIRSVCQQPNYSGFAGNPIATTSLSPLQSLLGSFSQTEASQLLNMPISNPLPPSTATWLPRQASAESLLRSGAATQCDLPQVDQLGTQQGNNLHHTLSLPPFSERDSSVDQEGSTDPQNNLLFGVNIDSPSLLAHNGMSSLRGVGSECESTNVPFAAANFLNATNTDYPLNPDMTPSSCIDESDFLPSPENGDQGNPQRTFVKVHKSGSFGRSLDITRFSSYYELRSELASMFGLEGQLEDPLRSGWQLVFVDRENDVLLLGDDPWQEFVDSVWCIKILSPQEVHQLGRQGLEVLNLAQNSVQKLTSGNYDDHVSRQDPRNTGSGITAVGSLDY